MNKLTQINIGEEFLGRSYGGSHGSLDALQDPAGIARYVSAFLAGAIALSGVILLFLLIAGGIGMIAGAGNDNPEQLEKGKKAATSALIGFIVVIAAYWIVKLIESLTGLNLIGGI